MEGVRVVKIMRPKIIDSLRKVTEDGNEGSEAALMDKVEPAREI